MITRKLRGTTVVILTEPCRQTSLCLDVGWNTASGVLFIMPKISEISVENLMESFGSREIFRPTWSTSRGAPFCPFRPVVRPKLARSFSAEKLSKFGSRRNRKLRSGWKLWFNRTMSFHFLLVSGQPGRSRARVRREHERERRSPRNEDSRLWGKKDDRSRSRLGLTGRFGKIHKMESTPGVWCVSCSSNFKSS